MELGPLVVEGITGGSGERVIVMMTWLLLLLCLVASRSARGWSGCSGSSSWCRSRRPSSPSPRSSSSAPSDRLGRERGPHYTPQSGWSQYTYARRGR